MPKYLLTLLLIGNLMVFLPKTYAATSNSKVTWWKFQSIDTMKYSRDRAREKLTNTAFDAIIQSQIKAIAQTGATHVAIGTPYDQEFVPFLKRWVKAARENNLNVWFRGNFSGWEGWFEYAKITREEHMLKTQVFITQNADLFEDGDIFTPCPECENGGPGDPRLTGDVEGFRKFLIDEYRLTQTAFFKLNKGVLTNFNSMNGDVAKLIMDKNTTKTLGGIVTVDHYVATPKKLADDLVILAESSGGKIVLGEFGAPIPDIHGEYTQEQQAKWLEEALDRLSTIPQLYGLNYWTDTGSSTEIWREDGTPKQAVEVLTKYYSPKTLEISVINELDKPIKNAVVATDTNNFKSTPQNVIKIPYIKTQNLITIRASNYKTQETSIERLMDNNQVILEKQKEDLVFKIQKFFKTVIDSFKN